MAAIAVIDAITVSIDEPVIDAVMVLIGKSERVAEGGSGNITNPIAVGILEVVIDAIAVGIREPESLPVGVSSQVVDAIAVGIDKVIINTIVVGVDEAQVHHVGVPCIVVAGIADPVAVGIGKMVIDPVAIIINPAEVIAIEPGEVVDLAIRQCHAAEIKTPARGHAKGKLDLGPITHVNEEGVIPVGNIGDREAVLGIGVPRCC